MGRVEDKAAIVTGGTRGIGLAIARALLDEGARVLICARNKDEVNGTVEGLRAEFGNRAFGVTCDVSDPEQVSALFKEAVSRFGSLDILINNAGIGSHSKVEEMTLDDWNSIIGTNLSGVFFCCREAVGLMKKGGGGYIINIGSLAGKNPIPGMAAYCASKFGLLGFTESLMQEVRYDHIRVSCVMPGSVNTDFGSGKKGREYDWKLQSEDIAAAVVSLIGMDPRALASRIELRPSEPKK